VYQGFMQGGDGNGDFSFQSQPPPPPKDLRVYIEFRTISYLKYSVVRKK